MGSRGGERGGVDRHGAVINARHLVATAAGNIAACSAQVARALAWQLEQEAAVIS